MFKISFKFVALLLPILLVYGLFRMSADPTMDFLPGINRIYETFASSPAAVTLVNEAMDSFNDAISMWQTSALHVTDLISFFSAVGAFFNMLGGFFVMLFNVLVIPFRYVGWFYDAFMIPR